MSPKAHSSAIVATRWTLVARGRFRGNLLGALKHLLGYHRDRANAKKRGGRVTPEPLDPGTHVGQSLPAARDDDRVFDRQCALTRIACALEIVSGELRDAGKDAHFDVLKPWLASESATISEADAAQTVRDPAEVDDELRHRLVELIAQ